MSGRIDELVMMDLFNKAFIRPGSLLSRRRLLSGALAVGCATVFANCGHVWAEDESFGFAQVKGIARDLAARPYQPPPETMPDVLRDMTYDQYRAIRFRPDHALWAGQGESGGFTAQFFHRGFLYRRRVRVNVVGGGWRRAGGL